MPAKWNVLPRPITKCRKKCSRNRRCKYNKCKREKENKKSNWHKPATPIWKIFFAEKTQGEWLCRENLAPLPMILYQKPGRITTWFGSCRGCRISRAYSFHSPSLNQKIPIGIFWFRRRGRNRTHARAFGEPCTTIIRRAYYTSLQITPKYILIHWQFDNRDTLQKHILDNLSWWLCRYFSSERLW